MKIFIGIIFILCIPAVVFSGTPDIYEDDNSFDKAGIIGVTSLTPQHHNFHIAGDQDWMKFYALANESYDIQAKNITNCAVIIELYQPDGVTPIKDQNGNNIATSGDAMGEAFLSWSFSNDGVYFIKVRELENAFGDNTGYDITVSKQLGPMTGSIRGIVTANGSPIGGVKIKTTEKITAISSADGYYGMDPHPSGNSITLTAEAGGYETYTASITLKDSESLEHDICLCPLTGLQKGDINGDSFVDLKDAIQALKILSGLSGTYCKQADVNGDNRCGFEEVIYILQKVAVLR